MHSDQPLFRLNIQPPILWQTWVDIYLQLIKKPRWGCLGQRGWTHHSTQHMIMLTFVDAGWWNNLQTFERWWVMWVRAFLGDDLVRWHMLRICNYQPCQGEMKWRDHPQIKHWTGMKWIFGIRFRDGFLTFAAHLCDWNARPAHGFWDPIFESLSKRKKAPISQPSIWVYNIFIYDAYLNVCKL